ncbi:MAG: DNA internalization-related competence protein ComEC/Rec2 [Firmicutes bacterium]|nr:DNA internalization-related competence protein ComEC/Rec2 [Bacillota bacterium]
MKTPLFLFAVALILALTCGIFLDGGILLFAFLLFVGIAAFFLLHRFGQPWYVCTLLLVFALGFGYGELRESMIPENPFSEVESAALTGRVVNDPVLTDSSLKFRFKTESFDGRSLDNPVDIMALVPRDSAISYGDELELTGTFMHSEVLNPGGFDYGEYQLQKGQYGTFSALYDGSVKVVDHHFGNPLLRLAYSLKHRFERSLSYLPAEQTVLIRGIFFGDTSGIDLAANDVLSKSGIRHCFAVSGLHVGYILLFLNALGSLLHFGRVRRFLLIVPCLFLYAAMTGFSPSVMRASVMCLMVLGAGLFSREKNSFNGLGAAALVLLLWNPSMLQQAGFQLSFIAMFSILFFMPWLEKLIPWEFPGKGAVLVTVAAQIGMIPVLAYLFHVVSFITFFISTICCLLVGGMVLLCFAALFLSIISPFFGACLLIPCGLLGEMILSGAAFAVDLPFAYIYKGDFGILWLIVVYALLVLAVSLPKLRDRRLLSSLLVVAVFIVFMLPGAAVRDELKITFLSVGQGDAIHIHTPAGEDWLIDCGDAKHGSVSYYTIRPYLLSEGVSDLDHILLSHDDDDHSGGVAYLAESFDVGDYVLAEAAKDTYDDILAVADDHDSSVTWVRCGDMLDLGDGVALEVFWPKGDTEAEDNALSLVVKLTYGDFETLFTGDAEGKALQGMMASAEKLQSDILKIPHHGSKNSYDEDFYHAVDPDAVVISVGKNSYGHPDDKVIAYFERRYVDVFRTDLHGAVTITTDGQGYSITPYRNN